MSKSHVNNQSPDENISLRSMQTHPKKDDSLVRVWESRADASIVIGTNATRAGKGGVTSAAPKMCHLQSQLP
jgi:hypothetical protein